MPPKKTEPALTSVPGANDVIVVDVREPDDTPVTPPGDPVPGSRRTVELQARLLDQNDRQAAENRAVLKARGIRSLNFVSSPGAGKTALLERTLDALAGEVRCAVLVGDLETDNDARRLRRPGLPVAQITTGGTCHLDASMIARGLAALPLEGVQLLFIENVGNLVCPASQTAQVPTDLHECPRGHLEQDRYRDGAGLRSRRGAGQHPARGAPGGHFRTLRPHGRRIRPLARVSAGAVVNPGSGWKPPPNR
jgi:hypothetical protein